MFFNQLTKSCQNDLSQLSSLLKNCIQEPDNIEQAKQKINELESFTNQIFEDADDKRKAPNPKSIPYFLSYFWQIQNYEKWPIYYTSLVNSLKNLGIWESHDKQSDSYEFFYNLINKIKSELESYTEDNLTHWDIEHCFWWHQHKEKESESEDSNEKDIVKPEESISFNYKSFIPPVVSDLIELGGNNSSENNGIEFEKKVTMIFKMLDFTIEELGQGTGREPDLLAFLRPENTAFIIDAKSRKDGYTIGTDDREIKEYISRYLIEFRQKGYKKTGFIIVSSSFKSDPHPFIDDITLETDIKRLTLLTSEALLFLLAFKLKEGINVNQISEILLTNGIVSGKNVVEVFEDI